MVIFDYILGQFRMKDSAGGSSGESKIVTFDGMPFEALTDAAAVTIPAGGKLYTLNIEQDTTITFPTPGDTICYFWLYLTTGSNTYTVTLPANITWDNGIGPITSTANSIYRLAILWDAPTQKWLGSEFWKPEALS